MKRLIAYTFGFAIAVAGATQAWAGEAWSDASASNRGGGSASANAGYNGNGGHGIARTNTRTGKINLARGVAVGVDRNGIDLSFSHAIAGRFGPAYAGTFNMSIGRDGSVSHSYGQSLSRGGNAQSANAGGYTQSGRNGTSMATAGGRTWGGGRVQASTKSHHSRGILRRWRR